MIVSTLLDVTSPAKDAIVNTLYFNVSGPDVDGPNYQSLVDDLYAIWSTKPWAAGRILEIRAYNMDDPATKLNPRPVRARKRGTAPGTIANGPPQIALCLSYYADRNLPRQRGRLYLGPWNAPQRGASTSQVDAVMTMPGALAGLGGLNVDWSLWSPTTQTHTRINHAWCDDSWDVHRSRKIAPLTPRKTWTGNG